MKCDECFGSFTYADRIIEVRRVTVRLLENEPGPGNSEIERIHVRCLPKPWELG